MSAEDADTDGVEGATYLWTPDQVSDALDDASLAEAAMAWWGVTEHGCFDGSSILHRPLGSPLLRPADIDVARSRLLAVRSTRTQPGLDDKVLTQWAAMGTAALAEAALATDTPTWAAAAIAGGEFLLENLRRDDRRWMRSWQADGGTQHLAGAADLAAVIDAFTRLSELTGLARWLDEAQVAAAALLDGFEDPRAGGFFTSGNDAPPLITRAKDLIDGAMPSANSAAVVALSRLAALTGEHRWDDAARRGLRLLGTVLEQNPTASPHVLGAVVLASAGPTEVVIPGDQPALRDVVTHRWRPGVVLAWGEPKGNALWKDREVGKAYVCRAGTCRLPVTTPDALASEFGDT